MHGTHAVPHVVSRCRQCAAWGWEGELTRRVAQDLAPVDKHHPRCAPPPKSPSGQNPHPHLCLLPHHPSLAHCSTLQESSQITHLDCSTTTSHSSRRTSMGPPGIRPVRRYRPNGPRSKLTCVTDPPRSKHHVRSSADWGARPEPASSSQIDGNEGHHRLGNVPSHWRAHPPDDRLERPLALASHIQTSLRSSRQAHDLPCDYGRRPRACSSQVSKRTDPSTSGLCVQPAFGGFW